MHIYIYVLMCSFKFVAASQKTPVRTLSTPKIMKAM